MATSGGNLWGEENRNVKFPPGVVGINSRGSVTTTTTAESAGGTTQTTSTTNNPVTVSTSSSNVAWTIKAVESIKTVNFMRARSVKFTATGCKPNTKLYPFFDDERVEIYCSPSVLITDANGNLSGTFRIPGNKFQTGVRVFKLSSESDGKGTSGTSAEYQSIGFEETVRTTNNKLTSTVNTSQTITENVISLTPSRPPDIINTVVVPKPPKPPEPITCGWGTVLQGGECVMQSNPDPLAQSFNTYNLTNGIFITSIRLYFKTKHATEPVLLQLRTMQAGYPSPTLVQPSANVTKPAAEIVVSSDASIGTTFTFPSPIYLEPNSDYCFVVKSNSQAYEIFVSEMGKISLETGKMITEQPFVGSLFKSSDNYTWTAEQFKDIKFNMYRAKFNTTVPSTVHTILSPVPVYISTYNIFTTENSKVILISVGNNKHGLDTSSVVRITTTENPSGSYNGFTYTDLTGEFNVTKVINDYMFECTLITGTCTSTGVITNSNCLSDAIVIKSGSGYVNPTISISGGGGTNAAATVTVLNGKIVKATVTNRGSGYTSPPTIVISDSSGTGAELKCIVSELFLININNPVNVLSTYIPSVNVSGTTIAADVSITDTNYLAAGTVALNMNSVNDFKMNALIASRYNEVSRMGNNSSCTITYNLSSISDYVSPVVYFDNAAATTFTYHINNQEFETIDPAVTSGTASVASYVVVNGGNYAAVPTITISPPGNNGITATGTVVLSGGTTGSIISITPGVAGTEYTYPPVCTISNAGGGSVTAVLTEYNSELTADRGNAIARYISNKTSLVTPSTGATVFVDAYSHARSSFDVYLRTSLSTDDSVHNERGWMLMVGDVTRNKSTSPNQILEYKLTLNDLQEFDTFDVKIVLRSLDSFNPPVISNYRLITVV